MTANADIPNHVGENRQRNDFRNDSHLPECNESMIPDFHNERWVCICPALRACEQRAYNEKHHDPGTRCDGCHSFGFEEGVQAARDAVAAINPFHMQSLVHDKRYQAVVRSEALAAIDALRGSGNPGSPTPAEKGEQA